MCLIYKTSQDFHDNSVHMYILRLRNYPVEIFVNNNNNNNNNNSNFNWNKPFENLSVDGKVRLLIENLLNIV